MNKKAMSLLEKILKSNKFKFTGAHHLSCNNTCLYGLFETVYCALKKQTRINCGYCTKRSTEFVLEGSNVEISPSGGFRPLNSFTTAENPIFAKTKEELLKRLKAL
jgi:hypothetical protein